MTETLAEATDPTVELTPQEKAARMLAVRAVGLMNADRDAGEESHRADYVMGFRDKFAAVIFEGRLTLEQPRDFLHSLALSSLTQAEIAAEEFVSAMEELDQLAGAALEAAAAAEEADNA